MSGYVPFHLLALGDYAGLLFDMGNYRELVPVLDEVIERANRVAPRHRLLIGVLRQYGFEALRAGNMAIAEDCYRQVLDKLPADSRDKKQYEIQHAFLWCRYTDGQLDRAREHAERVMDSAQVPIQAAWAQYCLARVLEKLGDENGFNRADAEALRIAESISPVQEHGIWLERLSLIFTRAGQHEQAERLLRLAVTYEESRFHPGHPRVADRLMMLGNTLKTLNRTPEAIPLVQRASTIFATHLPKADDRIKRSKRWLAEHRAD